MSDRLRLSALLYACALGAFDVTLQAIGGFPTSGATEDSTLGYVLGARGVLMAPMPMLELVDLPVK